MIHRQHTEPADPQSHHWRWHTLLHADGAWAYEVADTYGNCQRHDVWLDTEIADLLETADGPFDLWQHDWQSLPVGLLVVHTLDTDWYVLPESWI